MMSLYGLSETVAQVGVRGILLRVFADATIVSVTYTMAFLIRFLWITWRSPDSATAELVQSYAGYFVVTLPVLLAITSVIFFAAGFYTFTRSYGRTQKTIVIVLASSVAYLIFIVGLFVLTRNNALPPRAVPFIAWTLATVSLLASRFWSRAWKRAVVVESRFQQDPRDRDTIEDILVIGGAGFIGSVLVRQLLDAGYRVLVMDAFYYGEESLDALRGNRRVTVVEADSRSVSAVAEAMRRVDAVVHLGEIVGDPACALDEDLTIEINVLATRMLAEIAKGYGIQRFVYASSCSVYGATQDTVDESSELHPVSLYARSKIASESAILSQASVSFAPTVLRLATVFGWSPRPRFDLVANLLAAKAAQTGEMTVFGGSQWRPFVHVEDVASAIVSVLQAPIKLVGTEVFNVGSDSCNSTILNLAEIVQEVVPAASIRVEPSIEDARNYRVNFSKIRNVLGLETRWSLERGIRQVVDALTVLTVDIQDPRYSNFRTLSESDAQASIRGFDSVFNGLAAKDGQGSGASAPLQ